MPPVDEFGLIARYFAPLAARHPGALGLTDDAAFFPGPKGEQWAVTADALVAGVHFLADDPPELIARKLIRVNLSDLAAKGARPFAILMATCFPKDLTDVWLERFAAGLKSDCDEYGIALIGGDTVATPGPLTLAVTALGRVKENTALLRSNARSGDDIWVSGTIGDGAFGLDVALGRASGLDRDAAAFLLDRYRLPQPRVTLGPALIGSAHAGMDISDGLLGDLGHICKASGVGAVIHGDRVPLSAAVRAALAAGLGDLTKAMTGGDDYELLFTAPPSAADRLQALGASLDLPLTPIGRIIDGQEVSVVGADGAALALPRNGYRHFGG